MIIYVKVNDKIIKNVVHMPENTESVITFERSDIYGQKSQLREFMNRIHGEQERDVIVTLL